MLLAEDAQAPGPPQPDDAMRLAESLRERITNERVNGAGVTASVGVASLPQDGATSDELLDEADMALSAAVEAGGDHVMRAVPAVRQDEARAPGDPSRPPGGLACARSRSPSQDSFSRCSWSGLQSIRCCSRRSRGFSSNAMGKRRWPASPSSGCSAVAEQVREFVADSDPAAFRRAWTAGPGSTRRPFPTCATYDACWRAPGPSPACSRHSSWCGSSSRSSAGASRRSLGAPCGGGALRGLCRLGRSAGLVNFDALFTWFHGLFFAAGTWEFPADSLLIELFPDGFWVAAGVTWAALVASGGLVLAVAGWFVRRAETRERLSAGADNR